MLPADGAPRAGRLLGVDGRFDDSDQPRAAPLPRSDRIEAVRQTHRLRRLGVLVDHRRVERGDGDQFFRPISPRRGDRKCTAGPLPSSGTILTSSKTIGESAGSATVTCGFGFMTINSAKSM